MSNSIPMHDEDAAKMLRNNSTQLDLGTDVTLVAGLDHHK